MRVTKYASTEEFEVLLNLRLRINRTTCVVEVDLPHVIKAAVFCSPQFINCSSPCIFGEAADEVFKICFEAFCHGRIVSQHCGNRHTFPTRWEQIATAAVNPIEARKDGNRMRATSKNEPSTSAESCGDRFLFVLSLAL